MWLAFVCVAHLKDDHQYKQQRIKYSKGCPPVQSKGYLVMVGMLFILEGARRRASLSTEEGESLLKQ